MLVTKTADIPKLSPLTVTNIDVAKKSLLISNHRLISKRIKVKKNFLCQTVRYGRLRKNLLMLWTPRLVYIISDQPKVGLALYLELNGQLFFDRFVVFKNWVD